MKSSELLFCGVLLILFWSCSDLGDAEITGCMEISACNHNPDASISDGSCLQLDCNSECGGDAVIDSCGTCAGIIMNASECECPDGQTKDCTGVCGGTAEEDCTGECGGTNQNCVSFSSEIQLIFDNNCTMCHGNLGGLDLSEGVSYNKLYDIDAQNYFGKRVKPYDAENSILWNKIANTGTYGGAMPQGSSGLNNDEAQLIETWINEGAKDN